jgi:hypothetical protein
MRVLQLNSNHLGGVGGQVLALAPRHDTSTLQTLMGLSRGLMYALEENVSLVQLQLKENPQIVAYAARLQYYGRINQAGRYLLRSKADLYSLWPQSVLEGLAPFSI